MEFTAKKNNNASCDLTITFNAAEVEVAYKKAYERAKEKVKIPGFRPGKAPLDMVEKVLGDSVIDDAANVMLNQAMADLFDKLEHKPIRIPQFQVESFDRKTGAKAKATYDTKPEVILPKLKKIKIQPKEIKITDADIQKELEGMQKNLARNSLKEEGDKIEATDLLEINYKFKEDGKDFPDAYQTGKFQMGATQNPPGFEDNLLGMKMNEEKEFNFRYPDSFPQAPESAGKTLVYIVKVTAIYKVTYPDINDDFASEVDGSANLQELKDKTKKQLEEIFVSALKKKAIDEAYTDIIKESKFIIPESLIKEETEGVFHNFIHEFGLPHTTLPDYAKRLGKEEAEVRESFGKAAEKRIQTYLLKHKIGEEYKITISDEEWEEGYEKEAGTQGILTESLKKEVQKQKAETFYRDKFLFDKIDEFVYGEVDKKSPKSVSIEEAEKLLSGKE
ncbi:trigger factor [Leptospira ilyithenensis]|uniref:Trigger factor n=1 Tax=Leptospira ilyithenensis TaxID=2484901 RepID=A0A4R9LRQ8_9LEPT|nr:trigger factor [Leptospira ilyithenensis]TGN13764.1 trigger factor [Leptospira ilyithenensis]